MSEPIREEPEQLTLLDMIEEARRNGHELIAPPQWGFRFAADARLVTNRDRTVVRREIIPSPGATEIWLPEYARPILVSYGRKGQAVVHVWFEVVTDDSTCPYKLRTYATGDMIPSQPEQVYIGTAQDPSIMKAWHVYMEVN